MSFPVPSATPMRLDEAALVIFDFDGVVADSEVLSLGTLWSTLRDYGIDFDLEEVRANFLGKSLKTITAHVEAHSPGRTAQGFADAWQATLFAKFRASLEPVPGLIAVLDHLNAANRPHCIASSSSFERIGVALEAMELTDRFAHVFSAEQVARGKPAPDLFHYAAREMGVPASDCLVIEDSPFGVQAAKRAGMRCIGFVGGQHLAGLEDHHGAILRGAGADAVIDRHRKLLDLGNSDTRIAR